jgi:DNA topoisomerase-1
VAGYLGNTPAVCRASYIDPRVFDAYQAGLTIGPAIAAVAQKVTPGDMLIHHPELEAAVLDLLSEREDSTALERVAA